MMLVALINSGQREEYIINIKSISLLVYLKQASNNQEMNAWQTNPKGRLRGGYHRRGFPINIILY